MAVHADHRAVDVGDRPAQVADQGAELGGHRVAHGVRDVDGASAGLDGRFHDLGEKIRLGPRPVLGRKLHVLGQLPRRGDRFRGPPHDFPLRHAELELPVERAGGQEDVQPGPGGVPEGVPRRLDVTRYAAGQRRDPRPFDLAGDGAHRFVIPFGHRRKTRFQDVHPKSRELPGHPKLAFETHTAAR